MNACSPFPPREGGRGGRSVSLAWSNLPQCYEFDTGETMGGIQPCMNYHGVCGLMHRDWMVETVRHYKAFLNAEYYLRPGSGMVMYPRQISLARETAHALRDDAVAIRFPAEPAFGLEMDLVYRPHGDAVDMRMQIRPSKDIPAFEIFFASYVVEAFDETWVPLRNGDGSDQYHGWDTAHDWCYGRDLVSGQEMVADTRLVYRQFVDVEAMCEGIVALWESFERKGKEGLPDGGRRAGSK